MEKNQHKKLFVKEKAIPKQNLVNSQRVITLDAVIVPELVWIRNLPPILSRHS